MIARNRVQHPENISMHRPNIPKFKDISKSSHFYFMDENEVKLCGNIERSESTWLYTPSLHVNGEKLIVSILEVEKFCDWLEEQINTKVYGR